MGIVEFIEACQVDNIGDCEDCKMQESCDFYIDEVDNAKV